MFDAVSYAMGKSAGKGEVVIDGDGYTFSDPNNDGNIVVTKNENAEEVSGNG